MFKMYTVTHMASRL